MQLIFNNDIDNLKELGVKFKNVNFLEPFSDVDID